MLGRSGAKEEDQGNRYMSGSKMAVVCGRCDVTQSEVTEAVVRVARQASGKKVSGVLHLAGKVKDGMMMNMGWDDVREVVLPKVGGLRSLQGAVKEESVGWV